MKAQIFRRFILFIISLFFIALGISISVKAALGISPVSCFAYVISRSVPFSLGVCLFFWNFFLVVMQIIILGKDFKKIQLMQIPLSLILSVFTDWTKYLICADVVPGTYLLRLACTASGCVSLAFGIALSLIANVVLNAGEGFVKAIADKSGKKFGNVKVAADVTFVLMSVVLSLILSGEIAGVREGTLIAAVFVGMIVKVFMKYIKNPVCRIMKIEEDNG